MATQEELAALFSRNLSFQPVPAPLPPAPIHQTTKPEEAITYSITQHYHHSAHIAAPQQPKPRPASETDAHTAEIILARHGVDASSLFPTQLELFRSADSGQQMRLVELWRISPPTYGGHALANDLGSWPATSLAQEEAMAQLRYERAMMEERAARHHSGDMGDDVMSDGEQSNAPLTPIQHGGDGRGLVVASAPEPYMVSGYEALAAREYEMSAQQQQVVMKEDPFAHFAGQMGAPQPTAGSYNKATDPVYASSSNGWATRSAQEQRAAMEDVYGGFAQRSYGGVCYGYTGDQEML